MGVVGVAVTINSTEFTRWQDGRVPGPPYTYSSPNLMALLTHVTSKWAMYTLGCYGIRPVNSDTSTAWSTHAFGAALDAGYDRDQGAGIMSAARRLVATNIVIPFLIANSAELGIQAIHDYVGGRIWRSYRALDLNGGWAVQTPDSHGMGQKWATWLHIETHTGMWLDSTPIPARLHPAIPVPQQSGDDAMPKLYRDTRYGNVFLIGAGVTTVGPVVFNDYVKDGVSFLSDTHDQSLISYMRLSKLTMKQMVRTGGTPDTFVPPADLI